LKTLQVARGCSSMAEVRLPMKTSFLSQKPTPKPTPNKTPLPL
jgi:hypothetical protein